MGKWIGSVPVACDICHGKLNNKFIDGATIYGPWAIMCPACHEMVGLGLGTGLGQKYVHNNGSWEKDNEEA